MTQKSWTSSVKLRGGQGPLRWHLVALPPCRSDDEGAYLTRDVFARDQESYLLTLERSYVLDVMYITVSTFCRVCRCLSHSAYWLPTPKNHSPRWPIPLYSHSWSAEEGKYSKKKEKVAVWMKPGMVANPACGQLVRIFFFSPGPVRA